MQTLGVGGPDRRGFHPRPHLADPFAAFLFDQPIDQSAPRANEIMVAVAVTDSGRPLPRVGGLTVAEIKGEDGLR